MRSLILGGVRSGKSRLAERLARAGGGDVVYVATATAGDDEMRRRIDEHRARRPAGWVTVEEPIRLADALTGHAHPGRCLLVECLTLWLTNLFCADDPALPARERAALLRVLPRLPGVLILVSNETNLGVVPVDPLSRRFCEEAGTLHQELAALCDRVVLTVAGLPHVLKGDPL
ncbi:MAG: bifunctional adenosylcobinamide kinase/adenosylcobinamide-phosphate guanylyltransferase [Pseudomonadota bacterium]